MSSFGTAVSVEIFKVNNGYDASQTSVYNSEEIEDVIEDDFEVEVDTRTNTANMVRETTTTETITV